MKTIATVFLAAALLTAGCANTGNDANPEQTSKTRAIVPTDEVFESTFSRTVKIYSDKFEKRASGAGVLVEYSGYHFIFLVP